MPCRARRRIAPGSMMCLRSPENRCAPNMRRLSPGALPQRNCAGDAGRATGRRSLCCGIDGIETTRRLKRLLPQTQIIILSGYADDARVIGALRAGAITYVEKDSQPEQLLAAVRGAAQGKAIFEPALMQRVLQAQTMRISDALTEREGEVLRLLAEGLTNAEIAARLSVSEETVKTHVASILRKPSLAHRTQAAIYALRHGWV